MKRIYEVVVVIKPTVQQEQRKTLLETIRSSMKDVKITKEDDWGQKVLSYPIQKEQSGYFTAFLLEGENALPQDFEKKLIANENVLRHLVVRRK